MTTTDNKGPERESAELLIAKGGYLTKRKFSFSEYELQYKVQTEYPSPEWDSARRYILHNKRCLISKSAIRVANTVKAKLEIDLFPLIIPVATKGFNLAGGTAAFAMYDKKGTEYLFDSRANQYYSKKRELYFHRLNGLNWISINE